MSAVWVTRWARSGGLVLNNLAPTLRQQAAAKKVKSAGGKGAPAGGDGGAVGGGPIEVGKPILGANYLKDGKDPVYQEEDQYPPWLFKLLEPRLTLEELNKKFDEVGPDDMPEKEYSRLIRLINRHRIKSFLESKRK